eukprot:TRINITY_DN1330_c3_g1_i1.p1 TRINITY_DN1330_c3_g1~~TRINITY_DN1330_c3_g1_i1.p1  ORF type:complete len:933 (+),score=262.85 TRINITY_DN1330_c3_g1_i1:205-3003(+)
MEKPWGGLATVLKPQEPPSRAPTYSVLPAPGDGAQQSNGSPAAPAPGIHPAVEDAAADEEDAPPPGLLRPDATCSSFAPSAAPAAPVEEDAGDEPCSPRQQGAFSRGVHLVSQMDSEDMTEEELRLLAQRNETQQHISMARKSKRILADDAWVPAWELVLLAATLYFEVTVTLNDVYNHWSWERHGAPDVLFTLCLLGDIAVRFNMAYYTDGVRRENTADIARHYLGTWLIPDLLAALPFDLGCQLAGRPDLHHVMGHLRLVRLLRVPTYFEQVNHEAMSARYIWIYYQVVPIVLLVFWSCATLHGFIVIRLLLVRERESPDYVPGLYWVLYTVTTVGYGDIEVRGEGEQLWACFLFAFGVFANAAMIGKLTKVMSANDIKSERKAKMLETLAVMEYYSIPSDLQQEVLAFQNHILQHNVGSSYSQILSGLPTAMQQHIGLYVRIKFILAVPMFSTACADSRVALAEALINMVFGPGQYIIAAGEVGNEMFFLGHGYADVIAPDGTYLTTIKKGGFFGEVALLIDTTRTASIRALTYCDCFRLDKADFHAILDAFPAFKASVGSEIAKREEQQKQHQLMLQQKEQRELQRHTLARTSRTGASISAPSFQRTESDSSGSARRSGAVPEAPAVGFRSLASAIKRLRGRASQRSDAAGSTQACPSSAATQSRAEAQRMSVAESTLSCGSALSTASCGADLHRAIQNRLQRNRAEGGLSRATTGRVRQVLRFRYLALRCRGAQDAGGVPRPNEDNDVDLTNADEVQPLSSVLNAAGGVHAADQGAADGETASQRPSQWGVGTVDDSAFGDLLSSSGLSHPPPSTHQPRSSVALPQTRLSLAVPSPAGGACGGRASVVGAFPTGKGRARSGAASGDSAAQPLSVQRCLSDIRAILGRLDSRLQNVERHCLQSAATPTQRQQQQQWRTADRGPQDTLG